MTSMTAVYLDKKQQRNHGESQYRGPSTQRSDVKPDGSGPKKSIPFFRDQKKSILFFGDRKKSILFSRDRKKAGPRFLSLFGLQAAEFDLASPEGASKVNLSREKAK